MEVSVSEWSVLWLLCAVLVIRSAARRTFGAFVLLIPVVAPLAVYIVSLSLSAWPDYMLHARTSLDPLVQRPHAVVGQSHREKRH